MLGKIQRGCRPISSLYEEGQWRGTSSALGETYQRRPGKGANTEAADHERHAQSYYDLADIELVLNIAKVTRNDSGRKRDRNNRHGAHSGKIYRICQSGSSVDLAISTYTTCTYLTSYAGLRDRLATMSPTSCPEA